jgi:hypothetical protein
MKLSEAPNLKKCKMLFLNLKIMNNDLKIIANAL